MKKISLFLFLFLFLLFNLDADMDKHTKKRIEKNYAKAKKAFSIEDFNLIDKRLDKYDFKSEVNKSILFAFAPQIRGCLRKIGIKEKDVFLDALDVIGYLFKYECIFYIDTISNYDLNYIIELINGKPYGIFNRMNKKVNSDKYGDKAKENFEESYSENKVNTVKQTLKQISTDLLASSSKCKW